MTHGNKKKYKYKMHQKFKNTQILTLLHQFIIENYTKIH